MQGRVSVDELDDATTYKYVLDAWRGPTEFLESLSQIELVDILILTRAIMQKANRQAGEIDRIMSLIEKKYG